MRVLLSVTGDDQNAFEATLEQANWLFENGFHEDAGFWFEQLLSPHFAPVLTNENRIRARLGHCYLRTGWVEKAAALWETSLHNAQAQGDLASQATFTYNLAHVRASEGRWDEAIRLYENAVNLARQTGNLNILGQAYFVMARLRASQVELSQATLELRRGLSLIERRNPGEISHAQALVYAGDVHRYLDDPLSAISYYHKAGHILDGLQGEWPDWRTQVLAGTGAAYTLSSRTRRVDGGDLVGALNDLKQAFENMNESLSLAIEKELDSLFPVIFDRMGEIFLELHDLETLSQERGFRYLRCDYCRQGIPKNDQGDHDMGLTFTCTALPAQETP